MSKATANSDATEHAANEAGATNFIHQIIEEHNQSGRFEGKVHTRFPPEPNGYLHIGHAKSIVLNFSTAEKFNGLCNLRFDDTNPAKEEVEFVESIQRDVAWLGYSWDNRLFHASDYFDQLYAYAVELIEKGKAYVDSLSSDEFASKYKGTPTQPGKESPYRNRSAAENLQLFEEMKNGKHAEGSHILRAKIDMASPNMHLRDPALYRIKHASHYRTGDRWHIYPMYDFAHGLSDSLEGVTHSLCTLEFEVHRPLYDWIIDQLDVYHPQQIEFARLNLSYTVVSKRKLKQLVDSGVVDGWNDPRMPTISALRRRGYTPESIKNFAHKVGVARRDNIIDVALLEHSVREHLNRVAPRRLGIQRPLKLVITNWPADHTEQLPAVNNPEDENAGTRHIPFTRELYIEQDDFMENPPSPRKFFRLGPERMVRLKYAYIIRCTGYTKDPETGEITEVQAEYYPESKSGQDTSGLKVKGTLGWVSAPNAVPAEVRLYDRLFSEEQPEKAPAGGDFMEYVNPDSLQVLGNAMVEPSLNEAAPGFTFQFERQGYFCIDTKYSTAQKLVINRTVTLKDAWARQKQKSK